MASLTGKQLGNYLICEELGRGAMGVVFKAKQLSMDRYVALKFLPTRFAKDEKIVARFLREARAAGQLSHPNIVGVHDAGIVEGLHFIAMEFVDGASIHKRMQQKGSFSEKETLNIAGQIAEALKIAHGRGILHRDIKPDNFLIDNEGRVRLADLGLARFQNDGKKDAELTQDGSTLGTPHYMSPEQCSGTNVDARSDLYSLGASMYVMATGQTPFEANTAAAVMVKCMTEPPRPLKELNPSLSAGFISLVEKAMAKEPEKRFADAQQILDAIEKCKLGQYRGPLRPHGQHVRAGATPANAHPPIATVGSRLKPLLIGAGAGVLALIVLSITMRGDSSKSAKASTDNLPKPPPAIDTAKPSIPAATPAPAPVDPNIAKPSPAAIAASDAELRAKHQGAVQRFVDFRKENEPKMAQNPALVREHFDEFFKRHLMIRNAPVVRDFEQELEAAETKLKKDKSDTREFVKQQLEQHHVDQAIGALLRFEKNYPETSDAVEIHKEVSRIVGWLENSAKFEAAAGRFDDARQMLSDAIAKLPPEYSDPLRKDLASIEDQRQIAKAQADENKRLTELSEKALAAAHDTDLGGKRYRFDEAAKIYHDGRASLKTAKAQSDADALADLFTHAQSVMERMKSAINNKAVVNMQFVKSPGKVIAWDDHALTFEVDSAWLRDQGQTTTLTQTVQWKTVTGDDLLKIAAELKIGANSNSANDAIDIATLAFAVGTEGAQEKLDRAASLEPKFKSMAEAASHLISQKDPSKSASAVPNPQPAPAVVSGDREAAAKQLYAGAQAAREKKQRDVMLQSVTQLMSAYANTEFVQSHMKDINDLFSIADAPKDVEKPIEKIDKADKIEKTEKNDKPDSKDEALADLKKLGWEEVQGAWTEPSKGMFVVKGGGELRIGAIDAAAQVAFQLDSNSTIGVYARYEPETDAAQMKRKARSKLLDMEVGKGYGFLVDGTNARQFGCKTSPLPGVRLAWKDVPLKINTIPLEGASHAVRLAVHEDKLEMAIDQHPWMSTGITLRAEGGFAIVIEGNAKLSSPQVGK